MCLMQSHGLGAITTVKGNTAKLVYLQPAFMTFVTTPLPIGHQAQLIIASNQERVLCVAAASVVTALCMDLTNVFNALTGHCSR